MLSEYGKDASRWYSSLRSGVAKYEKLCVLRGICLRAQQDFGVFYRFWKFATKVSFPTPFVPGLGRCCVCPHLVSQLDAMRLLIVSC